ncbi:hypothetical protein HY345_03630 [Candidatus Microgenomates bacterium]|nr:hypothetical protein [Candidatus Microgenomates bacterium]
MSKKYPIIIDVGAYEKYNTTMSARGAEQISWGEAARRGAGDIFLEVLPKSALSIFIAESLITVKNALHFNISDWEFKLGVPAGINLVDFFARRRYKTLKTQDSDKERKIRVSRYDLTPLPSPKGLSRDFDFKWANDVLNHSPAGSEKENLRKIFHASDAQAAGLIDMFRYQQARDATIVFETSLNAMVVVNTWALPAILNSPLPWEQKGLLIGGLAAVEFGLCTLQRKWGILPEVTTLPHSPT